MILISEFAMAGPPTYGAEFELTNLEIVRARYGITKNDPSKSPERKFQLILAQHLMNKCVLNNCSVEEVPGKFGTDFVLKFSDGFWIKYSIDPSCIEITFKPLTLDGLKLNTTRVNEYVFNSGAEVGLISKDNNTTHFNVGINSLFNSVEEFLRFFIDYTNRPDLALGSLGKDLGNAPPLSLLKDSQRSTLKNIVQDFNKGLIPSIQVAADRIQNEVYTDSFLKERSGFHYQAVGLKYVNRTWLAEEDAPMELRSVWAQHSMEDFIRVAKLVEGRVAYLNKHSSQIIYNETKKINFSKEQLKTRFKIYVEESGLNFQDYVTQMPQEIQTAKLTAISEKTANNEEKLMDLIHYFDLLSTSKTIQNTFVDVLSDPHLQNHPRCKAYQLFFKKMSPPSTYLKILHFLGFSENQEIKNSNDLETQKLYKDLSRKIELNKRLKESQLKKLLNQKSNRPSEKILSCAHLF